jgi:parvulin-like peptidyl-prolyl isomerase
MVSLNMDGLYRCVKTVIPFSLLTVTIAFLISCSETTTLQAVRPTVVATVGDRNILSSELVQRLALRSSGLNPSKLSLEQKQSVLNEIIQRELQIAAAYEAGFAKDTTVINALENFMVNKLRTEQLEKQLAEVNVFQSEIESYYQQNLEKYTTPAMTRLAIIRFSLSSQANSDKRAAVKAQAEQAYQLALTLPDAINGFGSLAAKYSDHQASRYAGGDMGWIKPDVKDKQIDDAIITALNKLKQNGDLAPLVEGDSGYYLVKLLDRRAEKQSSIDKVGSNIQRLLERESRKQTEDQWLLSLQNNGQPLVINQDVLAAIELPVGSGSPAKQYSPPLLPSK